MIPNGFAENVVWQGEHTVRPYAINGGTNRVFARVRYTFRQLVRKS
jgi:hypothetical protein